MEDDADPATMHGSDRSKDMSGILDWLPERPLYLTPIAAIALMIQFSMILAPETHFIGFDSSAWWCGLPIGIYSLFMVLSSTALGGIIRRIGNSMTQTAHLIGLGGFSIVITAFVGGIALPTADKVPLGSAVWYAMWAVSTAFGLKPAYDSLLDRFQRRR